MAIQDDGFLVQVIKDWETCCRISRDGKLEYLDAEKTMEALDDMFFNEANPNMRMMIRACRVFVGRIQEIEEAKDAGRQATTIQI